MQLLAGSVPAESDHFLHAGYMSAAPRTYSDFGGFVLREHADGSTPKLIDVKSALELKGDEPAASHAVATVGQPSGSLPPMSFQAEQILFPVIVVLLAYYLLLKAYAARFGAVGDRGKWTKWLLATPTLLAAGAVAWGIGQQITHEVAKPPRAAYLNSLRAPWEGVAVTPYKNPAAATEVLLRGLIANGLIGVDAPVRRLEAIQYEIGFPVRDGELTPGMRYALKTYGLDGWGRPFQFTPLREGAYMIGSAGPDGVFGNNDDIVHVTPKSDRYNWENHVAGLYVRQVERKPLFYLHRVDHQMYVPNDLLTAASLTGGDLFDAIPGENLLEPGYDEAMHPLRAEIEEAWAAQDDARGSLYLVCIPVQYHD